MNGISINWISNIESLVNLKRRLDQLMDEDERHMQKVPTLQCHTRNINK